MLLNTDQYQHISFGGLYVKIRSAVQKLWTKKWFCTVSLASISYSVTWKMCLLHTQNSFLRVPAKCFPQSWVGGSYLFLSFWWCTMYLSRQQAQVPFQICQIRTVWHFDVPMKKSNYTKKRSKIEILWMFLHNLGSIMISRNVASYYNLIPSLSYTGLKKGATINVTLYDFRVIQRFRARILISCPNQLKWSYFMFDITYCDRIIKILLLIFRKTS